MKKTIIHNSLKTQESYEASVQQIIELSNGTESIQSFFEEEPSLCERLTRFLTCCCIKNHIYNPQKIEKKVSEIKTHLSIAQKESQNLENSSDFFDLCAGVVKNVNKFIQDRKFQDKKFQDIPEIDFSKIVKESIKQTTEKPHASLKFEQFIQGVKKGFEGVGNKIKGLFWTKQPIKVVHEEVSKKLTLEEQKSFLLSELDNLSGELSLGLLQFPFDIAVSHTKTEVKDIKSWDELKEFLELVLGSVPNYKGYLDQSQHHIIDKYSTRIEQFIQKQSGQ